jgi:predicted metalloprotease with PDZ domain
MLFGHLTSARLCVKNINVEIFSWSKTNKITADHLTWPVKKAVSSVAGFIERKPADYYTFLFHFEDQSSGAHEHPSSSLYVLREQDFKKIELNIAEIVAHEFYHLETPFRIREKKIAAFNFKKAVPTEHLWFYEGVTEWASHLLLLRYGVIKIQKAWRLIMDLLICLGIGIAIYLLLVMATL